MVVTKVHQIKSPSSLTRSVKYIIDESKTLLDHEPNSDINFPIVLKNNKNYFQLVSGHILIEPLNADKEFIMTKKIADIKTMNPNLSDLHNPNRVMAHHIIQSFSPTDYLLPEEVHEIGRKTALELTGGEYEFVIATHLDKGHLHNHIIFNTTNSITHKKFRWQKGTARSLMNISNKRAEIAGAKILNGDLKNSHKSYSAYHRQNNFKSEIKQRLDFLLKHASSIEDFNKKAQHLNLEIDFSGKYVKYKLTDKPQKKNTRDDTLSKRRNYSLAKIKERVAKNTQTFSVDEIKKEYDKFVSEQNNDFEMKIHIEDWQIEKETDNGLYLEIDYGLLNSGVIKIPAYQVDKLSDGSFDIFIKKSDYFYFTNEKDASKNKYMKGSTVAKQLSRDNRQLILNKNKYISKLDQAIKDFEFLSVNAVSNHQQFTLLYDKIKTQVDETENELNRLDNQLIKLNKIASAVNDLQSTDELEKNLALKILNDNKINPKTKLDEIIKLIEETQFERKVLNDKYDEVVEKYINQETIKENVRERENKKIL